MLSHLSEIYSICPTSNYQGFAYVQTADTVGGLHLFKHILHQCASAALWCDGGVSDIVVQQPSRMTQTRWL